jgi:signal transduction histidine kinase
VRRRLLLVLLAFSALAVTAFAQPLLMTTAAERTARFVNTRTGDLDRFAALAQQAIQEKEDSDLRDDIHSYRQLYGDGVAVVDNTDSWAVEDGLSRSDPEVRAAIDGALKNQPAASVSDLRPWSSRDVLFAGPIGTDTRVVGAVVIRASVRPVVAAIRTQWTFILLAALVAALLCVCLAMLLARWVLRPLGELERGVIAVTDGQGGAHIGERSGPPELRTLAARFNRMSSVLAESTAQQRRLVADASHELRGPIARLSLTVEELAGRVTADGQAAFARVATEAKELESLSAGLLNLANADRAATEFAAGTGAQDSCDALELLVERGEEWHASARRAGVTLCGPESEQPVRLALPEIKLKQMIDVVLDNAIKYAGSGAEVRMDCAKNGRHGRVTITDNGPGLAQAELVHATTRFWRARRHRAETGSGLGLAIAERLVTAVGGELSLRANDPHGFVAEFTLPLAEEVC